MSARKSKDRQRGAVGAAEFAQVLAKEMAEIHQFEKWLRDKDADELDLVSFNIRAPKDDPGDYLVVIRCWVEGRQMVGFHGGETFVEVVLGAIRRLKNDNLRWKEDQYASS
jgi:hypothetical protein